MGEKDEERIEDLRTTLIKLLETNFSGEIIQDDVSKSPYMYTDEEIPLTSRRAERLGLMLKARMLLAEVYKNISLIKSFYIIHQGLINFTYYSIGRPNGEKGNLYDDKAFDIPSEYGDQYYSLHDPKQVKSVKEGKDIEITDEVLAKIRSTIDKEKCDLPNAYLWLKAKHQMIDILFQQARYDEVIVLCDNAKSE